MVTLVDKEFGVDRFKFKGALLAIAVFSFFLKSTPRPLFCFIQAVIVVVLSGTMLSLMSIRISNRVRILSGWFLVVPAVTPLMLFYQYYLP